MNVTESRRRDGEKMGDKKPRWAAVFRRKILVVKSEGDPRLLVHEVFQRQICRVVTIRMHEGELGIGFDCCKERIKGNAFPSCA